MCRWTFPTKIAKTVEKLIISFEDDYHYFESPEEEIEYYLSRELREDWEEKIRALSHVFTQELKKTTDFMKRHCHLSPADYSASLGQPEMTLEGDFLSFCLPFIFTKVHMKENMLFCLQDVTAWMRNSSDSR